MNRIKVLLVDDHPIVRQGLRLLLSGQDDMEVVGEAASGPEALKALRPTPPDVAFVDLSMPRMSGFEAVSAIRQEAPETRVVVFSVHDREEYVHRALAAGALGYVLKGAAADEILEAVRAVARGDYFLSSKVRADIIDLYIRCRNEIGPKEAYDHLSEREQQVFRLLVEGETTGEIAGHLYISPKTVEKHRANIMKKLGINDLLGMVKYAVRVGIIDPGLWKI